MSFSLGITLLVVLAFLFIVFFILRTFKPRWRSCIFSVITFLCACVLLLNFFFSVWGKPPPNVPAPVSDLSRIPTVDGTYMHNIVTLSTRDGSTAWTYNYFHPDKLTQMNKGNNGVPYDIYLSMATSATAVYTAWGTGKDTSFTFISLNKQNGRVLWSVTHQSTVEESACDTPLISYNLIVSGSIVYVLMMCEKYTNTEHITESPIGVIYVLQAQNGAVLWRKTLAPLFLSQIDKPLAATAHLLIVGSEEATYALRTSDGSIAWQLLGGGDMVRGGDMVPGGDRVYSLGPLGDDFNGGVSSFRLQDGALCYVPTHGISRSSQGTSCISPLDVVSQPEYTDPIANTLVFSGSTLYLTQDDQAPPYVNTLYAINEPGGNLRWKHSLPRTSSGPNRQHIVIQGNSIYVADGPNLSAYQASNGNQLWQRVINSISEIDTMTAVDGILFLQQRQLYTREIVFCIVDCEPASGSFALNPTDGSTYWRR